ncbi:hexokinase-2-like [Pelobates fuscus]|uniref:hexokinase-2-like n=1 Tax=Pelobates fuscus TaxID=191477 RepID=UPI002FE4920D
MVWQANHRYKQVLQQTVKNLCEGCHVKLETPNYGPEIGTALVTAIAKRTKDNRKKIKKFLEELKLPFEILQEIQARLRQEMERGLVKDTHKNAILKMFPTYICQKPEKEEGEYIVLEFGDQDINIMYVNLGEEHCLKRTYKLPDTIKKGKGEQLFDHIAECLLDFQETENLSGKKVVSFIFSFPCEQTDLKMAKLTQWTKGIEASDCVGQNVVDLLQQAINKKEDLSLDVIALANDTTGTMMSCCSHDPSCEIGMIAGEGTNACYMENRDNIETVKGNEGQMCVNMEWGAFGDNGSLDDIFTPYDSEVDRLSINPGKQRYEKMIGGMYLGEIVRQALISINKEVPFNQDKQSNILQNENLLSLEDLCDIETDELSMAQLNSVLLQRGLCCTSDGALLVKEVCRAVSQRAAQLCAAGIAAVVEKIHENCQDERKISVGVTGSLYTEHPHFARNLTKTLKNLIPGKEVNFKTSDGHGIGAALIASVAEKTRKTL